MNAAAPPPTDAERRRQARAWRRGDRPLQVGDAAPLPAPVAWWRPLRPGA